MKNKITTYSFLIVIFGFFILNIFVKDIDVSESERRNLQKFPEINLKNILNKSFMDSFDKYALDQFVLREDFRSLKAYTTFNILNQTDNNKIYIKDNMVFKSEYPLNKKSIDRFVYKLNNLKQKYFKENKVYYSIIPDKNYYVDKDKYLNIDYDYLYDKVISNINDMEYIDLRNILTLEDYYRTDTHWSQNKILKVVDEFGKHMGFEINHSYEIKEYSPFYGVYYGQSAMKLKPDTIYYLTNDIIDNVIVSNYEKNGVVYDENKLGTLDSYDVYLSGSTPLVTLENKQSKNNKELIIFRDSFASSLTPLLIQAYSKITLVDIRYMTTNIMEELIEFKDQDILFLYSTLIVNNSSSLKN